MIRFFLILLLVIKANFSFADSWPKVSFSEWPSISVAKIKAPEPVVFPFDVPGSVQPKPKPVFPAPRICQEKQTGGFYIPVRC